MNFRCKNCTVLQEKEYLKIIPDFKPQEQMSNYGLCGTIEFHGKNGIFEGFDLVNGGFLTFDAYAERKTTACFELAFWDDNAINEGQPSMRVVMGILPNLKVRIAFNLQDLDGETLFPRRTPGKLKTVIHGHRLHPDKISLVTISIIDSPDDLNLSITSPRVCSSEPDYPLENTTYCDKFGQIAIRDWENKIKNEQQLKDYLNGEYERAVSLQASSDESSRYGGYTGLNFGAGGFFRTHNDGQRWWLVDPDGYAFISVGPDCVNPGESTRIADIEPLFEYIPEITEETREFFNNHENHCKNDLFFDFQRYNLYRAWGKDYFEKWATVTRNRLSEWKFNTVANWTNVKAIKALGKPYVYPLDNFPTTQKTIFRDFPDVFSDEYSQNCAEFARQLEAFVDDRLLIGYFLSNEPNWAFINDLNIAEELLAVDEDLVSKHKLIEFLTKKYINIAALNSAWSANFSSFDELYSPVEKACSFSLKAKEDLTDFSKIMIERFVGLPSDACKAVDKNHLNLGIRYAFISSEMQLSGCEHFDVFSINLYKFDCFDEVERIGKMTGKPIMIGEFHFGAVDSGPMSTGLRAVTSQTERGIAYRHYIEHGCLSKYFIGAHYFSMNDQGSMGRFDGENYQIGLVDCALQPYEDMLKGVLAAHQNMYQIALGKSPATNITAKFVPLIAM